MFIFIFVDFIRTSINQSINTSPLQKIVDILGRDTHFKKNKLLFYIYQDGTVRRHIVIE